MANETSLTTPDRGSSSWGTEMENLRFGGDDFAIVVEGFEPSSPVGDSQMFLRLEGQGWRIGGEARESFSVVVPKLVESGRTDLVVAVTSRPLGFLVELGPDDLRTLAAADCGLVIDAYDMESV